MQYRLLILISVLVILIGFTLFYKYDSKNQIKQDDWKVRAPQLFMNAGYSKLIESKLSQADAKISESEQKLEGKITNPFGIRDDILDFIITNVPSSNESALRAAILSAQLSQEIYYGDITQAEAIKLVDRDALVGTCLDIYLGGFKQGYKVDMGIDKLMRNTKVRDKHMWDIDRKYFSWKVLGSGLSVADEKIACQKGDF